MKRYYEAEDEHDEAPPSYAEATGSSRSAIPAQTKGYMDEKERLRRSLRSISVSSARQQDQNEALQFTVDFKKPMLDFWTLNITPSEPLPGLSYWQLKYSTRYKANMWRHAPEPQSALQLKEIAEIQFPSIVVPGCGPTITFWPHEEEIERRGLRHVSATDRFMHCTGWLTTEFAMDLPALASTRVVWMVPKGKESTIGESDQSSGAQPTSSASEKSASQPSSRVRRNLTAGNTSWTPFPTQNLVEESSDRVLATYSRAAPWSKHQGYLTILPSEQGLSAEVIEVIVITTAAMVGMQDAIGLASSLIESGFDLVRSKGKSKCKETG